MAMKRKFYAHMHARVDGEEYLFHGRSGVKECCVVATAPYIIVFSGMQNYAF